MKMRALRRHWSSDRGSATLELLIVFPALLAFLGLLIVGGHVALAHQHVQHAAEEAARTASIARTQSAATTDSQTAAQQTLHSDGLTCTYTTVNTDTAGFRSSPGTPATLTSTVSCTIALSDLSLPGVGGSRTITATATSPLDTYRSKSLGFTNSEAPLPANPSIGGGR